MFIGIIQDGFRQKHKIITVKLRRFEVNDYGIAGPDEKRYYKNIRAIQVIFK
jgi:hypothetical protein